VSHIPDMNVFPVYQSHVKHINASCHKYRLCLPNSWTSRVPYLNESHLNECDLSQIKKNESCTTYENESCSTYERVMQNIPQTHPSCSSCVCTFACVYVWMCSILLYVFEIPPQTPITLENDEFTQCSTCATLCACLWLGVVGIILEI